MEKNSNNYKHAYYTITMDKRKLHHGLTQLRRLNYHFLIAMSIFFAITALLALRSNNQRMIVLRNEVFKADRENGDTEAALRALREYVFSHMNTNLSSGANAVKPPIQLKYRYERLVAAEKAAYEAENAKVVKDAEATCIARYPGSVYSQARLQCAKEYALAHPVFQKSITDDMYKFDFVSPKWSPDFAGWSIVLSAFFLFLFFIRYLSEFVIRRELSIRS